MVWLTGWNNRRNIVITGSTVGDQLNYQIQFTLNRGTGTSTGCIIYLGSNVNSDFGDIRFTRSDGVTLLNYWIESTIPASPPYSTIVVWVQVDYIPISPSTGSIYVYYNNLVATTTSNPISTFDFFDDFNDNNLATGGTAPWTIIRAPVQEIGGILKMAHNGEGPAVSAPLSIMNAVWEWDVRLPIIQATGYPDADFSQPINDALGNYYNVWIRNAPYNEFKLQKNTTTDIVTNTWVSDTNWHRVKITRYNGSFQIFLDGISKGTGIDNTITSNTKIIFYAVGWGVRAHEVDYDNLRIRKFVSPEPICTSSGAEETIAACNAPRCNLTTY